MRSLEYEMKASQSKEEYIPLFERYIYELKNKEPEKTLDDVVDELQEQTERLEKIEDALTNAPFQEAL